MGKRKSAGQREPAQAAADPPEDKPAAGASASDGGGGGGGGGGRRAAGGRRRDADGGAWCPDRGGALWVMFWTLCFGVLPIAVLFLPVYMPPLEEQPHLTMQGGAAQSRGVRALWSVVRRHKMDFCTESGAPDTLNCLLSVWRVSWELFTAPRTVDFYVGAPFPTWHRWASSGELPGEADASKIPFSPLRIDTRWVEAAVCSDGVTRSQVARLVLEANQASKTRLPPIGTRTTLTARGDFGCLPMQQEKIPCLKEYDALFGEARVPVLGSGVVGACAGRMNDSQSAALSAHVAGDGLWGSVMPKAFYVYGLAAAEEFLAAIPRDLPDDVPVTVSLIVADDHGKRWYERTRGRGDCDRSRFRKHFEGLWGHLAWTTRSNPTRRLPRPKDWNGL